MRREIFFKTLCLAVAGIFFCETLFQSYPADAQTLPNPSTLLQPLNQSFTPVMIRGMQINPQDGLSMNLIVDSGDESLDETAFKSESEKLIKYFLTALTVPEKDLWVNLSPYEKDRITSDALAQTAMGEELLAQDYILKQLTAALVNPDGKTGKEFWNKIYEKAYEAFGTVDVPVDAFNKIWIMPETAEIFAQNDTVLILNSKLKVMLEEDYLAKERNSLPNVPVDGSSKDVKAVMREVVLPVISQEINEGENFAPLRQIFHALILARWYKDNLKESILGQVYADQSKVKGIDQDNAESLQNIYNQYLDAFRLGAQGLIKEEYDPATQSLAPRKYVTGGWKSGPFNYAMMSDIKSAAVKFQQILSGALSFVGFKVALSYVPGRRLFLTRLPIVLASFTTLVAACTHKDNQVREAAVEELRKKQGPSTVGVLKDLPKEKVIETLDSVIGDFDVAYTEFLARNQGRLVKLGDSFVLGCRHIPPTFYYEIMKEMTRINKLNKVGENVDSHPLINKVFQQGNQGGVIFDNLLLMKQMINLMKSGKYDFLGQEVSEEKQEDDYQKAKKIIDRMSPIMAKNGVSLEDQLKFLVYVVRPDNLIRYFSLIDQPFMGVENDKAKSETDKIVIEQDQVLKRITSGQTRMALSVFVNVTLNKDYVTELSANHKKTIDDIKSGGPNQDAVFIDQVVSLSFRFNELEIIRNKHIASILKGKKVLLLIGGAHAEALSKMNNAMMTKVTKFTKSRKTAPKQSFLSRNRYVVLTILFVAVLVIGKFAFFGSNSRISSDFKAEEFEVKDPADQKKYTLPELILGIEEESLIKESSFKNKDGEPAIILGHNHGLRNIQFLIRNTLVFAVSNYRSDPTYYKNVILYLIKINESAIKHVNNERRLFRELSGGNPYAVGLEMPNTEENRTLMGNDGGKVWKFLNTNQEALELAPEEMFGLMSLGFDVAVAIHFADGAPLELMENIGENEKAVDRNAEEFSKTGDEITLWNNRAFPGTSTPVIPADVQEFVYNRVIVGEMSAIFTNEEIQNVLGQINVPEARDAYANYLKLYNELVGGMGVLRAKGFAKRVVEILEKDGIKGIITYVGRTHTKLYGDFLIQNGLIFIADTNHAMMTVEDKEKVLNFLFSNVVKGWQVFHGQASLPSAPYYIDMSNQEVTRIYDNDRRVIFEINVSPNEVIEYVREVNTGSSRQGREITIGWAKGMVKFVRYPTSAIAYWRHLKKLKNWELWEKLNQESQGSEDKAMFADTKGGVDLSTSSMDFQSSGQIDRAVLQGLPRFNPNDVIGVTISDVTITPIMSVYRLLGLNEDGSPAPVNPDERPKIEMAGVIRES